jgi:hypothetical protein
MANNKVEPFTSKTTACPMLYPMYALPIADLEQLTRFPPHQVLLKAGKLVEIKDGMDVLFVSHQWLSKKHLDPESYQLKCLQRVLSRLADGELDVENQCVGTADRPPRQGAQIKNILETEDEDDARLGGLHVSAATHQRQKG